LLLLAVLSMLQATLTLPGIAAMALALGVAIDSNVLINERLREELRAGAAPQAAIHAGYENAWNTILDSNITTLIAGLALLAFGALVPTAEAVGAEFGFSVVNMRFVKPLDRALVLELAAQHEGFVTLEDNVVAGGAGSGVSELLHAEGVALPMLHLGLPDEFQRHASREELLAEAGLDAAGIRAAILSRWPQMRLCAAS